MKVYYILWGDVKCILRKYLSQSFCHGILNKRYVEGGF